MALFKSKEMRALGYQLDGFSFGIGVIEDREVLNEALLDLRVAARIAVKAGHREEVVKKLVQARTWIISGPEHKTKAWRMAIDVVLKESAA
jgi:hypothetical protein